MLSQNNCVKRLRVKNFRRFEKLDLSFDGHFYTALVGRNSTGKTSILEAINICLSENSSKFNSIKESDFYSDEPIEFEVEFENPFFLSYPDYSGYSRLLPCYKFKKVISRRKKGSSGQLFSSPYSISWQYEPCEYTRLTPTQYRRKWGDPYKGLIPQRSHIVWSFQKTQLGPGEVAYEFTTSTKADAPNVIRPFELQSIEKKELYPRIFFFDKDRDRELEGQYRTTFANIINELDWRYRRRLLKDDNKEVLGQSFETIHKKISDLDDHRKELLKPAIDMLNKELKIDFNIDNLKFFFFDLNQPYKNTIFGHKTNKDRIISISNCGSGIAILVSLALLIAFAKASKEQIIVLVDEPELHLHADLQKNLLRFLKEQSFQSIVSTHSHLFLDQHICASNLLIEVNEESLVYKRCNQIELADVQFRLLGNSLDDLFVPENLILVEGKYDRNAITKCLGLMNASLVTRQILDCEGKDDIPNKTEKYDAIINDILKGNSWFNKYFKKNMRIVADGDIPETKIDGWKSTYGLEDSQVLRFKDDQPGMEYLYPESLVKSSVKGLTLKDGSSFDSKSKDEIVSVILNDEKLGSKKKDKWLQDPEQRVSKQRLNSNVIENLTAEILDKPESADLKALIDWIIDPVSDAENADSPAT